MQHIDKNITGFFKVLHIKILDVIYSEGAGLWAGIKVLEMLHVHKEVWQNWYGNHVEGLSGPGKI